MSHLECWIITLAVQGYQNYEIAQITKRPAWRIPRILTGIYWTLNISGRTDLKTLHAEGKLNDYIIPDWKGNDNGPKPGSENPVADQGTNQLPIGAVRGWDS